MQVIVSTGYVLIVFAVSNGVYQDSLLMFKDLFKYYKSRAPPPDLSSVLHINNESENVIIIFSFFSFLFVFHKLK